MERVNKMIEQNLPEKKPNPPEKNNLGRRFFLLLLASGVLTVILHLIYDWIFDPEIIIDPKDKVVPPVPYIPGSGYQIRNSLFLTVPTEQQTSNNQNILVPVLGEYVKNFDSLKVEEHDQIQVQEPEQNSKKYYSVGSTNRTRLPNFTPKMLSVPGSKRPVIDKSIGIGRIDLKEIDLGELGKFSLDFGGTKKFVLQNLRQVQIEIGDFKFLSGLTSISHDKEDRVYFIDKLYIADIDRDAQAGITIDLNGKKTDLLTLESEFKNDFEAFRLVLGCEFQLIKSGYDLRQEKQENISVSTQELMARELEYTLNLNKTRANYVSQEPIIFQINKDKDKVQIVFRQPFISDIKNQRIQIISGDNGNKYDSTLNSIDLNLDPRIHTISYLQVAGNQAYTIAVEVKIKEDLSVEINKNPLWAAITWEPFKVDEEFKYQKRAELEDRIKRIDSLRQELFEYVVHRSSLFNIFSDSRGLTEIFETYWVKELETELEKIPDDLTSTQDPQGRVELAKYFLNYLKNGQLPPQSERDKIKDMAKKVGEIFANIKWMEGSEQIKSKKFTQAGDSFQEAANWHPKNSTQEQLNDLAISAYINAALREVEKLESTKDVENALKEKEQAEQAPFLSPEQLQHINAAQEYKDAAAEPYNTYEENKAKAWKLFKERKRERLSLEWERNPSDCSVVPYPWQRTVYIPGAGTKFCVTENNAGYVEADQASIQISAFANVDLEKNQYIAWDWRAIELPPNGDLRQDYLDDQAIQVVVIFASILNSSGAIISPGTFEYNALNYVWDTNAPIDTIYRGREVGFEKFAFPLNYLVVETGTEYAKQWRPVRRDLIEDFKKVFPDSPEPSLVKSITVQTNSWRTGTKSAGEVGQIRFTKELLSDEEKLH